MTKSNGIKSLKQAAKLLNKHAPDGESLAYINPEEAKVLRSRGGTGIQTLAGVPSYWSWDWLTGDDGLISKGTDLVGNVWDSVTGAYKDKRIPHPTKIGETIIQPGRSIVGDALSVWGALRAKKDQEGLNEAEMAQFNKLNQQLAAAETEFDVSTDFGTQLKAPQNVPETIEDVSTFTDVTLPTMKTTAVAEGGRIGYNMGGIDTPFQGIGALNPRMGYQVGSSDIPGIPGVGKAMRDVEFPTFSEGVNQEFPSNELGAIDTTVQEDVSTIGGNQIQETAIALINSGFDSNEALMEAHRVNSVESQYPGITKIVIALINSGHDSRTAIIKAAKIMEGSKQIKSNIDAIDFSEFIPTKAHGGRIGAQKGGIMPLLDMGGMEKDYRQDGGFVPIGRKEKADDVPARLSKNEFVFTTDAVRAAGGGDIDQGAQRMYNVMKNLEAGGEISKQSQGKR